MKNTRYEVRYVMKDGVTGTVVFSSKAKAYGFYNNFVENKKCVRVFIVEMTIIEGNFGSVTNPKKGRFN